MHSARIALLVFSLAVVTAGVAIADVGHEVARQLRDAGKILPAEQILEAAAKLWPGRVLEIELDEEDGRYVYEIELVDQQGEVHELDYDAATGELLKQELDD